MSIIEKQLTSKRRNRGIAIVPAMILGGLVISLGCGWLGLQVANPLQQAARLRRDNDALEKDLRRAEIRNQDAQKRLLAISTDEGAIQAARSRGFMFPQEHPLHVQSEAAPALASSDAAADYSVNGKATRAPISEAR